jgi:hypothetical protein
MHQSYKSDPDPHQDTHQSDADLHHCFTVYQLVQIFIENSIKLQFRPDPDPHRNVPYPDEHHVNKPIQIRIRITKNQNPQ